MEVSASTAEQGIAERPSAATPPTVVAVVWTYNRFDVVRECIESILRQSVAPHRIVVVDSHSEDGTAARVQREFPTVEVVALDDNDGMSAAIAAGIRRALAYAPDFVWFVEDDSVASAQALKRALRLAAGSTGMVGPVGAVMRHGLWTWNKTGPDEIVDFCMLDGALVSRAAIEAVGVPNEGYFIMLVDVEYPLRIQRAGFTCLRSSSIEIHARQLGAAAIDDRRPWRSYYQTRNHLRLAIDLRSPTLLAGFVARTCRMAILAILKGRAGMPELTYRLAGIRDGALGRMGRRVEPSQSAAR